MLNVMRDNLRHLKPVLWIVAISMIAYLGAYFSCDQGPGGVGSGWAARVNGAEIPTAVFRQFARRTDENYRQLFGDQYTQLRPQLQIGRQVIQTLVNQQIMLQEAEKLGIGASKVEIQDRILQDPSLKGPDGQFVGKEIYTQLLSRGWPGGVEAYERYLAESIIIEKWTDMVTSPVDVTEDDLREEFRRRSEGTEIDYVVLASADQEAEMTVSEDEQRDWYDAHPDDYRREEGRRIRYLMVERSSLLSKVEVSDDDIRAFYDGNSPQFSRPDERRASHILISASADDPPEKRDAARRKAEGLLQQATGGESFEELARTFSEDEISAQRGGDLGFFGRGAMVAEFETAAFETPVGEFAPLVETSFGFHVLRVTDERAAGIAPLEEVRDDIEAQIRQRGVEALIDAEAARLRGELASAEDLDRVAERDGLEVEEQTVRRGDRLTSLGVPRDFVDTVFALAPGTISDAISTRRGLMLAAVTEELPAEIAPLDEIQGRVTTDVLNDRLRNAARARAGDVLARHETAAKVAEKLGLELLQSGNMTPTRTLPRTGGSSPELKDALFGPDAVQGASGVAPVPAGAIVYTITKRDVFDIEEFETTKQELRTELVQRQRNTMVQGILEKLVPSYAVEINEELIRGVDT